MRRLGAALLVLVAAAPPAGAAPPPPADFDAAVVEVRELLAALVAADTSNPPGNEARATALGEAVLKKAGISYESHEFAPGRRNLIARLKGDGSARPLLLLAHVDVVGATGQKWATDPHKMVELDGHLVGRGVGDDLGMAAVALETLVMLKRSGAPLSRDVIVAWTGDEESGGEGIQYVLKNRPELVDAEIALNEGGGMMLGEDGKVKLAGLQMAEKTYQDYVLRATGPTGHSSVPADDNAIVRLSAALDKVGRHKFPVRLLPVTRAGFEARAAVEGPKLASALRALARAKGTPPKAALAVIEAEQSLRARIRTTCVPTQVSGGTRQNALPAEAYANVNCRILPDETAADVARQLKAVIQDPAVEVRGVEPFGEGGTSPLEGVVPDAVKKLLAERYPGVQVAPAMSTGASDSRYLRAAGIASYGFSPLANTEANSRRAHGIDERIPVASLRPGVELMYALVLELAGTK